MRWRWIPPLLILLLSALVAIVLRLRFHQLPVLSLQIDIASTVLLAGLLLSSFIGLLLLQAERRQRAEEELLETANQERRSLLRRLDHELKNPITAIFMGTANLRHSSIAEGEDAYIENIEVHARRMQRLTADLRKLADLETQSLEWAAVDMAELLRETFDITKDIHQEQDREFKLILPEVPWPLPHVLGDRDLLQLALHNLLENAVKFTRSEDSIEVRASEDGSNIVIEVADTGIGIPASELPFIWEELYRGELAHGVPGSGLGLALTKAIIERHGGAVSVRSRIDEGTIVTVYLSAG